MAFNSSPLVLLPIIALLCFLPLFSTIPVDHHSPNPPRGLLFEDKTRLGSTPPSCYNKCNQCHPCTAVQVPSMPKLHQVQPLDTAALDSYAGDNSRYSNYKPLGWKCRCKDHVYNP